MVVAQQLSDRDKENRTTLSENCLNILTDDELILMSDKAHFHLSGAVKKQNFRYWADSNPQQLHQRPLYCPHVIVWCGVASFGIAGWTSGYSHICSVCGDVKELSCSRITSSRNRPQEGVGPARWDYSPHCQIIHARCARNVSGPVCDYFLWGYFKSKVYLTKPRDIDEFKNAIKEEITAIPDNLVREAMRTLRDRPEQCRQDGGKRLRVVLFNK
ncbi:hypothetical protein Cfor_02553 [Coptotermes formosanus]|uniref:Uncharacterized protein n=1 Tax=Coptotermes formosanus TaxID=36987 RepID=A0A6L2PVI1_COPFO|nr:hypothetical protein Cfor_02553 [Coptotermes formosanus]